MTTTTTTASSTAAVTTTGAPPDDEGTTTVMSGSIGQGNSGATAAMCGLVERLLGEVYMELI